MNLNDVTLADRYTIEREIGRGGMASVWLAHDQQHGRRVAIKLLHPELAGAIGTDRFLREIRLTAELQHPGIVPILDSGAVERDGLRLPWYAMPYLDGETLRQRLNRDLQLPVEDALRIATAVGRALTAAHQRNIVHRDIKPENVFLSGDHVYVVDFGVAKAIADTEVERLTSTGLAVGTPTYMSPEQALAGTVDARSDQYSLAVLLYEMLTGDTPFGGRNLQATLARRMTERARPISTVRSTVPPAVEQATLRALERTPADRFASVEAFLSALSARSPSSRAPALSRRARHVSAVTVLTAVIVAAAAWGMKRPSLDPEVLTLYERGVRAYDSRTPAGAIEAERAFAAAISRDSGYAPAWTALAKTYVRVYQRGFSLPAVPHERLLQSALSAVQRALEIDRKNADAWATHAIVTQQFDPTDVDAPVRSIRRAIALDSAVATSWHTLAIMTAERGNLDSAITAWRRSVQLDPAYTQGLAFLGLAFYWRGEFDSAMAWVDSAMAIDPTYLLARQTAAQIETEREQFEQAVAHADAAIKLSQGAESINSTTMKGIALARAGQVNLARALLLASDVAAGALPGMPPHTALGLAELHVAVNDLPGALKALGMYATPRDLHFQMHLRCAPTFTPLAQNSTFQAMLIAPRPAPGQHC